MHSPTRHQSNRLIVYPNKGQLRLSIYVNCGLLTIHVIEASNLSLNRPEEPCAYVKIRLSPDQSKRSRCKTEVIQNSSNPEFDEKFSFEFLEEDLKKRILVSVWHKTSNNERSHFLGCMSFGIQHILSHKKTVNGWYYLLTEELGKRKHLQVAAPSDRVDRKDNRRAPAQAYTDENPVRQRTTTYQPGIVPCQAGTAQYQSDARYRQLHDRCRQVKSKTRYQLEYQCDDKPYHGGTKQYQCEDKPYQGGTKQYQCDDKPYQGGTKQYQCDAKPCLHGSKAHKVDIDQYQCDTKSCHCENTPRHEGSAWYQAGTDTRASLSPGSPNDCSFESPQQEDYLQCSPITPNVSPIRDDPNNSPLSSAVVTPLKKTQHHPPAQLNHQPHHQPHQVDHQAHRLVTPGKELRQTDAADVTDVTVDVEPVYAEVTNVSQDVVTLEPHVFVIKRANFGYGFSITGAAPVRVSRVDKGSPAESVGLQKDDLIVRLNGSDVIKATAETVARIIKSSEKKIIMETERLIRTLPPGQEDTPTFSESHPSVSTPEYTPLVYRQTTRVSDNKRRDKKALRDVGICAALPMRKVRFFDDTSYD